MASIKLTRSGTSQLSIKNKLLPKTLWATFDSHEQAEAYGKHSEGLLAQGIVPVSLLERSKNDLEIWTLSRCTAEYIRNNSVPVSDIKFLDTVRPGLSEIGTGQLNYDWAEGWIRAMKRVQNLLLRRSDIATALWPGVSTGGCASIRRSWRKTHFGCSSAALPPTPMMTTDSFSAPE